MRPKNFPARKLARRLWAQGYIGDDNKQMLEAARAVRTKVRRQKRRQPK